MYHIDLTVPLPERLRRYADGSTARTLRGLARYVLDHSRHDVIRRTWAVGNSRPALRPRLSAEEREDRRAAADPPFRRALLARLRRELRRAQRDYGLDPARWQAIAARIACLGGRRPEPVPYALIGASASREEVYAAAELLHAPRASRRARHWTARTTLGRSRSYASAGWTGWGRERECPGEEQCQSQPVRAPGAARRAGYRVHYHPALAETHLRAVFWLATPTLVSVLVHDRRADLPVPAGTTITADAQVAIVRPGADGPQPVLLEDAVRLVLAARGGAA